MSVLTNARSRLLGGGRLAWYRAGGAPAPIAAYCPKGAASLAASYVNLARTDGTYNAAPGTAPTFAAATGWTFAAASTQYLTTGIAPNSGWSVVIAVSGVASTGRALGVEQPSPTRRFHLLPKFSDDKVYYGNGDQLGVSPGITAGVLAVAGQQGYRNGTADGGAITGATGWPLTQAIVIGAYNTNGVIGSWFSGNILAVAIYNTTLTPTQVAAISSAMALL